MQTIERAVILFYTVAGIVTLEENNSDIPVIDEQHSTCLTLFCVSPERLITRKEGKKIIKKDENLLPG